MEGMKTVLHKQRHHHTARLRAESGTKICEPRQMVTGPSRSLPCTYVEQETQLSGRSLKENSIVNTTQASIPPPPARSSVTAEKNCYMNCHTQLYCSFKVISKRVIPNTSWVQLADSTIFHSQSVTFAAPPPSPSLPHCVFSFQTQSLHI